MIGLYLVLALEATSTRRARLVGILCGGLLLVVPARPRAPGHPASSSSSPFPTRAALVLIVLGSGIAIGFLWLTDDRFVPLRGREDRSAPATMT